MEFDLENPLTSSQDLHSHAVASLFQAENHHMPSIDYCGSLDSVDCDVSFRRQAISSILQMSSSFDPFLSYLAINYLDRFLSRSEMPILQSEKPWILRLLAVSCVSLAAKMKKTEFSLADFQGEGGFIFDSETIMRMEILVLGALKWRMRSVTPFSFISFFISLFKLKDPPLLEALKARVIEIILKSQKEIKLLQFKPSIIAASTLLYACHELFPLQFPCFMTAISNCPYVNKEKMLCCYSAVREMEIKEFDSLYGVVSSSSSPVNVLDRHCLSSESEKSHTTGAESDVKRRKISVFL